MDAPSRAEPPTNEQTPLLSEPIRGDVEQQERPEQAEEAQTPRRHVALLRVLWVSIGLSLITMILYIPWSILDRYGRDHFDIWGTYLTGQMLQSGLLASGFSGFFAAWNIIRLHKSNLPAPALFNLLVFGMSGLAFCALGLQVSYELGDELCSRTRFDNPDRWFDGTYKQCREWEAGYFGVLWTDIILISVNGLINLVLFIMILRLVYLGRTETRSQSRFHIPAGYFTMEVSLRWGSPPAKSGARPDEIGPPRTTANTATVEAAETVRQV